MHNLLPYLTQAVHNTLLFFIYKQNADTVLPFMFLHYNLRENESFSVNV